MATTEPLPSRSHHQGNVKKDHKDHKSKSKIYNTWPARLPVSEEVALKSSQPDVAEIKKKGYRNQSEQRLISAHS